MKMKELFKNIKELSKTTKGKAILFFGFYFVFFIIIMIIARFGSRNYTKPSDYEKGKSGTFYINDIVDKNSEDLWLFRNAIENIASKKNLKLDPFNRYELLENEDEKYRMRSMK